MNTQSTFHPENTVSLPNSKPPVLASILTPIALAATLYLIYTLVTVGGETLRALDDLIVYT